MPINFPQERWQRIQEDAQLWWAGELDRPLIQLVTEGDPPDRPQPATPSPSKTGTAYDLSITPEAIIDRWDYDLSSQRWLGDAFPSVWVDFGPGVIAAFMGASAVPGADTVWFHQAVEAPITNLQLRCDRQNTWLHRIKQIYRAGMDFWQGRVLMGMTDIGGNLDILSTFRPGEGLLYDLYEHPEDVKRLLWQAHDAWWECFEEFNSILQPTNPGYSAWASLYSREPYYMLQCDFAYMLGPDMFREFVLPELVASCRRLTNPFYHLDGVGQLVHLDMLLEIPELKGIQWIPGQGKPPAHEWTDVLKKVRNAGKLLQLWGDPAIFEFLERTLGSLEGIAFLCSAAPDELPRYEPYLKKYGLA